MGFQLNNQELNAVLEELAKEYQLYAPKRFSGGNTFSDVDCIRYGEIQSAEEIVFDQKSDYSFKEILLPVSETLFYFSEGTTREADISRKKGAVIFLRSCDLNAVQRLDDMYLKNGPEDYYYKRLRENVKFVLMGCLESYENCFCVDMGSNKLDQYSLGINAREDYYEVDCKEEAWEDMLKRNNGKECDVTPDAVTSNQVRVKIPENLSPVVIKSSMWREYDSRCIACGRCNFVCPTCTCFSMQDIFYSENGKVGERRRVHASCMVDGFTDVAGGGSYRKQNGDRMRFKVLHKVYDYEKRGGYHMCVGCGRCDDVCPEYISFSNCINKLEDAMKEVGEE